MLAYYKSITESNPVQAHKFKRTKLDCLIRPRSPRSPNPFLKRIQLNKNWMLGLELNQQLRVMSATSYRYSTRHKMNLGGLMITSIHQVCFQLFSLTSAYL